MTYRDDSEALRARIDVLENELAEAKSRIAELSGERAPTAQDGAKSETSFWLAAPTQLLLERELDVEPTPEMIDRLATLFRREFPVGGLLTPSDRAFGFRWNTLDASLTPIGGGRARLRLFVNHAGFAMLPSAMAVMVAFLTIPVIGPTMGPLALLATAPIAWLFAVLAFRKFIGGRVHRYRARFTKLFEAAAVIASEARAPVRVAAPYETSRVEELDDEADASERERRV